MPQVDLGPVLRAIAILPLTCLCGFGGGLLIHGGASLFRHEFIGLPKLGFNAASGPDAIRIGWQLAAIGLAILGLSGVVLYKMLRGVRRDDYDALIELDRAKLL